MGDQYLCIERALSRIKIDYCKMDPEKFSKLFRECFHCKFPLDLDDSNELVDVGLYENTSLFVLDEMCPFLGGGGDSLYSK